MRIWQFSEQAYHPAWAQPGPLRVTFPHRHCEPQQAGQLLNRYLDEYQLADELGLNIMVNEHHATATCMSSSVMTNMAILARITKRARLLALGIPLANRANPMRVAEEIALADCLSGGRVEFGFVKGSPLEVVISNRQPTHFMDRFWDAHDLILEAFANEGDVFSWESEHYHIRTTALWPRPLQLPHPPMWGAATSASSAREYARRDYVCATFLSGVGARSVFDGYRETYLETHGRPAGTDRLGYLAVVACASSTGEAHRRAEAMKAYFHAAPRIEPQFQNIMGLNPAEANTQMLLKQAAAGPSNIASGSVQDYIDSRLMFVGTPDEVYEQIAGFYRETGGFGNLLMMGQAGLLDHADTADNLTLVATEVLPRLAELPKLVEAG